jgi:adenylate kinase
MNPRLFILGAPGSGKGTVSNELVSRLPKAYYISVGAYLREQAKQDHHISQIHAQGGLVDSSRVLHVFDEVLQKESFICDGSPRKASEADYILKHPLWVKNQGFLLYLEVDLNTARNRLLSRGRFDDTIDVIDRRLEEFQTETMQSINLFREHGRLLTLDASVRPSQVADQIIRKLGV